jgi:hypothetical protein
MKLVFGVIRDMLRRFAVLTISILVSGVASSAPVSGKVEVLEKGNAKRAVVRDVLVYLEGVRAEIPASVGRGRFPSALARKRSSPMSKSCR